MQRYKFFILVLFSFIFSFQIFSQKVTVNVYMEQRPSDPKSDTIYYNFNQKLTWKDFQGTPKPSLPWGAMTSSGFSFNSSMDDDGENIEINVGVFSFFTKHDSWKRPDVNSDFHLEHEQHHFDITRLGAQELVEEIRQAHFTKNNYRKLLYSVFNKVYDQNIALQNQYDLETKNSMDVQKQTEWNVKITAEIQKLNVK